jgi:glutathione peroxidase
MGSLGLIAATLILPLSWAVAAPPAAMPASLHEISVSSINGETVALKKYAGQTLLVVNTASQCGYTPQYKGLQSLQEKYGPRGFTVLGFPSNDFGAQEPGANAEIKKFCELKYRVSFPLFAKNSVKGDAQQPVYRYLQAAAPTHENVDWNFEKFLIDRQGHVVARFKSGITPDSPELTRAIETELQKR